MSSEDSVPAEAMAEVTRDIAEVPAVEVITSSAGHLMSAAAIKCGLAEDTPEAPGSDLKDLDEARKLITALAGFVTGASPARCAMGCAVCSWPSARPRSCPKIGRAHV